MEVKKRGSAAPADTPGSKRVKLEPSSNGDKSLSSDPSKTNQNGHTLGATERKEKMHVDTTHHPARDKTDTTHADKASRKNSSGKSMRRRVIESDDEDDDEDEPVFIIHLSDSFLHFHVTLIHFRS